MSAPPAWLLHLDRTVRAVDGPMRVRLSPDAPRRLFAASQVVVAGTADAPPSAQGLAHSVEESTPSAAAALPHAPSHPSSPDTTAALRATETLSRAAAALEEARRHLVEQAPDEILEIALAVAREVVGGGEQGAPPRDKIVEVLRDAFAALGTRGLVIRMHPDDAGAFEQVKRDTAAELGCEVVLDASLHAGDVIVDGDVGRVEATREARLRLVERRLRALMHPGNDAAGGPGSAAGGGGGSW